MKVCVLGSGTMGSGIASQFAQSDKVETVFWWGRDLRSLENGLKRIKKEITRFVKKQLLDASLVQQYLNKIIMCTDFTELDKCDLYIEAIVEELDEKMRLFESIKDFISEDAIVATNTSSLSITALSMCTNHPSNFIGIHFFNPTSVMKLVEVVKGLNTSEEILTKVIETVEDLNKTPVVVNESPGFVVNRMLIPMINEAVAILAEGVANIEDIDKAMKYGANHPIGPLSLADLIGNDVCLSIMETLHLETGDPKYRAHPLLRQYVRAGFLGRKSKKGFYEY
jgi:3-hydroxybutyryl-CoA dehydrogenase